MIFPELTALFAGLLGLLFLVLSVRVSMARATANAHHGDGGSILLQRRIRIHANFAEYVPMALLLIGLAEAGGASRTAVGGLLVVLLVARIAHPFGMVAAEGSAQQYALRAPSVLATWLVMGTASVLLLLR